MLSPTNQGAGAKHTKDNCNGVKDLEKMLDESPSPERVSAKIAQILNVSRNEVAVLRVEKGSLRFVFPPELRAAGVIPMSTSAVSRPSGSIRSSLFSNSFSHVEHVSPFRAGQLAAV